MPAAPSAPTAPPPAKPTSAPPTVPPKAGVVPSAASTPAPHTPPAENDYMGDAMAELQQMDQARPESESKAPKRDPATGKFLKPKVEPKPEPKPEPETPTDETQDADPVPPAPKQEDEPKPGTMRALGKAYDSLKKERDEVWTPKLKSLEAEVAELRSKTSVDVKPIQERMSQVEKENAALREEIRFVNYQKHPEFTEKYEKPYTEAWTKAVSEVTQLTMEMEDGSRRKATPNDLLALANAPLDQLDDLAEKWFGKSAPRVIRHIEKVRDLAEAQDKALADAKKGAGERETQMSEQAKKQSEAVAAAYNTTTAEIAKKYPRWFAPVEGDQQGNEVLRKGFEYADSVFAPNGLSQEQKAKRLAIVRAKAANHDRLAMQLKARDARIAELEANLAQFEQSEPTVDDGGNPQPAAVGTAEEWEAELRKLAK